VIALLYQSTVGDNRLENLCHTSLRRLRSALEAEQKAQDVALTK